jgi:hypothetical protein
MLPETALRASPTRLHGSCGRLVGANYGRGWHMLRNLGVVRHAVRLGSLFLFRKVGDFVLSLHMISTSGLCLDRRTAECQRGDSNPHGLLHWILSPARLPIPPLRRSRFKDSNPFQPHQRLRGTTKKAPVQPDGGFPPSIPSFCSTSQPAGSRSSARASRLPAKKPAG